MGGGNVVNLRLYQNYRSHMPGMEDVRFHAVCHAEDEDGTLCAFRWPVAEALGERRQAPSQMRRP